MQREQAREYWDEKRKQSNFDGNFKIYTYGLKQGASRRANGINNKSDDIIWDETEAERMLEVLGTYGK